MKDGFALLEFLSMKLAVGQELTIDLQLQPAGVQMHGSVFEYVRSDNFDAPNYFDTAAAFFFGSYEGYRLKAGINFVEAVPIAPRGRTPFRRSRRFGPPFSDRAPSFCQASPRNPRSA